jgi:hypothetical protein
MLNRELSKELNQNPQNKMTHKFSLILILGLFFSCSIFGQKTKVSIKKNQFYINGKLTYKGHYWKENKIEGLLMNSRMVQGIFDDLNPATKEQFQYTDTKKWDADRNTNEFIESMQEWKNQGLLAFTLNLQGGSPLGYGNKGWINSTFDESGNLRPAYMERLEKILNHADKIGMVVILGYFYFGQDEHLADEKAVIKAVDNISNWLLDKKYRNILVEINNECDINYDHKILQAERVNELILRVQGMKRNKFGLLVGTSFSGGTLPKSNVVKIADFILLHGNGVEKPEGITSLMDNTKKVEGFHNQPLLFNEDDHFNFDVESNNFLNAIRGYASWGYFDYRLKGESLDNGYQSVPVDWGIHSDRKKSFFKKLKEITIDN